MYWSSSKAVPFIIVDKRCWRLQAEIFRVTICRCLGMNFLHFAVYSMPETVLWPSIFRYFPLDHNEWNFESRSSKISLSGKKKSHSFKPISRGTCTQDTELVSFSSGHQKSRGSQPAGEKRGREGATVVNELLHQNH